MPQPRQQQQYQRLNAFGEPFRGSKIGGVQARRYMGGGDQGPLSNRRYNVREEAEKEAMRQDRAAMKQTAARGQAAAGSGGASQSQQATPKREGQLIPTVGGGSKWASGKELDRMDAMKAKARKQARKTMDVSAKNAAGVAAFGTGKPPPRNAAEAATADRAKARARYEAEKRGNAPAPAPAPAMAEKKPEPRKEAVTPAATHSSPAKSAATPAPKPAAKTAQVATKAPTGGFSEEFKRRFMPSQQPAAVAPTKPKASEPPKQAKVLPRMDAAQAQAARNPQGLAARINPPGVKPKTLEEDPIAKPFLWAGRKVGEGLGYARSKVMSQARKNPIGLAGRVSRLFGS